ncbi:MAG: DUF3368 domain-containing protein [Holophagales bacterium]|nr:DUF3368 domain-containing protein [Holophagales bacterium]
MIVVSDTSPITNLASIEKLHLLPTLFGTIHVAKGVEAELAAGGRRHPGSQEIEEAPWVELHTVEDTSLVRALRRDLDLGEAETLALGLSLGATVVLMDEREGRHLASHLGLEPLGVLGILLMAKRRGTLEEIEPSLEALRHRAGFFIGDALYERVLAAAGEAG